MLTTQQLADKLGTTDNNIRQWKFKLSDQLVLNKHFTYNDQKHIIWLQDGIELLARFILPCPLAVTDPIMQVLDKKNAEVLSIDSVNLDSATQSYKAELYVKLSNVIGKHLGNSLLASGIKQDVEEVALKTVAEGL